MPVLKKEISLSDGTKIWVRQASGREKLKIETIQAKAFRKCRHFGSDPTSWTQEQNEQFLDMCEEMGANLEHQVDAWLPNCVLEPEGFDIDLLTSEELQTILMFVRGDTTEGAIPLVSSPE